MKKVYKIFTLISILLLPFYTLAEEIPTEEQELKPVTGYGFFFEEPKIGQPLPEKMNLCSICDNEKICVEINITWVKANNKEMDNSVEITEVNNELGYYAPRSSDFNDDLINKLKKDTEAAGYTMENVDDRNIIMYVNELHFNYTEREEYKGISLLNIAVGGVDTIEYTVDDPIIGEKPSSTVNVKVTPETAQVTNTPEVIWYKSVDGETYEEMTETDVFEENLYYRYELEDETKLYAENYYLEDELFTDAYTKVLVNGEEKQLTELKLQPKVAPPVITEPNPNTGDIASVLQISMLGIALVSTFYIIKRTKKSN